MFSSVVIQAVGSAPEWAVGGKLLFALLIGHALADYPLQGAFLAKAKDRHSDSGALFGEQKAPKGLWVHALTAHSLVHAGAVWLITSSALLAAVELVLHWIIDFAKCESWTGFHLDQALHVLCKIGYVVAMVYAVV